MQKPYSQLVGGKTKAVRKIKVGKHFEENYVGRKLCKVFFQSQPVLMMAVNLMTNFFLKIRFLDQFFFIIDNFDKKLTLFIANRSNFLSTRLAIFCQGLAAANYKTGVLAVHKCNFFGWYATSSTGWL